MADPLTPEQLAEIRSRVEAATPGEWRHDRLGAVVVGLDQVALACGPAAMRDERVSTGEAMEANARFIASARQDVPALLDEVERLRARVAELEAAQERHLRLIHDLSKAEPLPAEAEEHKRINSVLMAEVGTLRARNTALNELHESLVKHAVNERVADLTARHQEQLTAAVEQARVEEREAIASYLKAEARKSSDAADALPEGEEERHTYTGRWDAFRDAEVWVRARGSR